MPLLGLSILGTGPFALEVFEWLKSATNDFSNAAFEGFVGRSDGVAAREIGAPCIEDIAFVPGENRALVCAIADPDTKSRVVTMLRDRGSAFHTLVHPTIVAPATTVGVGSILCPNTVLGRAVDIGAFCTLNYLVGVGHQTRVGAYSTISPGVQIGGRTSLGERVFVGLSATIIDGAIVGDGAKIQMGSVVLGRVKAGATVFGNPARKSEFS